MVDSSNIMDCNICGSLASAASDLSGFSHRSLQRSRSDMTAFKYRAFGPGNKPWLSINVTEKMLPAQRHLLPVIAAIDQQMVTSDASWRLHLRIEDAEPFDVEF